MISLQGRPAGSPLLSGRFDVNIRLEFIGFPMIYDLFPEGSHSYTLSGDMLAQLIETLAAHEDPRVQESILDPGRGAIDPTIQIMINQKLIPKDQIQSQKIGEGDQITFLKLLAGG
jgi:sulfur carrier protein ThiS